MFVKYLVIISSEITEFGLLLVQVIRGFSSIL